MFTNWTLEITTLFIAGSLICSIDPNDNKNRGLLAVTHLSFQAALFMNFIAITVYWGVIHVTIINDFNGLEKFHMYTVHLVPCIAFVINWFCTDVVLYEKHRIGLTMIGVIYSIVNAYQTISSGVPLYYFLTW